MKNKLIGLVLLVSLAGCGSSSIIVPKTFNQTVESFRTAEYGFIKTADVLLHQGLITKDVAQIVVSKAKAIDIILNSAVEVSTVDLATSEGQIAAVGVILDNIKSLLP